MPFYLSEVLADNPSAYWRLGETSGTVAIDQIAGANGTIATGVVLGEPGALTDGNTAMRFTGTGQVTVPVGTYSALGTADASIEAWIKASATMAAAWIVDTKVAGSNSAGIALSVAAGNLHVRVGNGSSNDLLGSSLNYYDSQWHQVVGVVLRGAPDRLLCYFDGVLVNSKTIASGWNLTTGTPLVIGTYSLDSGTTAQHFIGTIDDVALYKSSLSATRVAAHYTARLFVPSYQPAVIGPAA